jgi:hypothetical protein
MLSSSKRALSVAWQHIGFVCVVVVLSYSLVGAFDPPRLNWGDSGSDYNVMSVGRNFQKYGFLEMRLTPSLLDRDLVTKDDSVTLYTHYPQLPDLANGVLRTAFGMSDVVQFRLVALAFSFGSLFFIYTLVGIYWSRLTAQLALGLWVTNPLWIQHADYLHNGPYGAFFGFGSVYFLVRSLRADHGRLFLAASGALLFLAYCSSYDYWIFTPLLLAMVTVAHFGGMIRRDVLRTLATLAGCALLAIACKVATNIWARGGIGPFLADLHVQAIEHSTGDVIRTGFADGIWPTLAGRVERHFSLLLFPLAVLWAVVPLIRTRLADTLPALGRSPANPALLLLAALPFLCAFPELWVAQYYPFLMVVPFYAVGFAALIVLLIESERRTAKAVGLAVLLAVSWNALDENLRFRKAFFERDAIRTLRVQLDTLAPPTQRILVNHVFDAAYRYYFNRTIFAMILDEPFRVDRHFARLSAPGSAFSTPQGMLFVQHKHLTDELFDKGYYNVLAHYRLWDAWANPPRYRRFLDSLISDRDSQLMAKVAQEGHKLYESDYYVLWRINPAPPATASPATSSPPGRR